MTIGELKKMLNQRSDLDDREIYVETDNGFRLITGIATLKQLGDGGIHARYFQTMPSEPNRSEPHLRKPW